MGRMVLGLEEARGGVFPSRETLCWFACMVVVAQLVEPRIVVPVVVGSSPIVHPGKKKRVGIGISFSGSCCFAEIDMEPDKRDLYETLASPSKAEYTVQRSKFIALAIPVASVDDALLTLAGLRKEYYDATHVCWAYAVGCEREENRMNDDGEPSGTAGRPIYGQILSHNLSDLLVVVVRYFGGVKLGTGGLIDAYKESARLVLSTAERKEVILMSDFSLAYPPGLTGTVMRLIKNLGAEIREQGFQAGESLIHCRIRRGQLPILRAAASAIFGITLTTNEEG